MKTSKPVCLLLSLLAVAAAPAAEALNTNVNPALLYYQAYLLAPQMSEAELDYLGTNAWVSPKLQAHYGELVARYDDEFNLVRQAARATAPCDWGLDMNNWPRTLMPHLARGKAVAIGCQSRTTWELVQGRQVDARDDLVATLALARNISHDQTIIGALVQFAMENIITWNVAVNFGQFSPETLEQLVAGFEAVPPPGTLAAALTNERALSHRWLVGTIDDLRKQYPGDDAKAMAQLRETFQAMAKGEAETDPWQKFVDAAHGSSERMLELDREAEPVARKLVAALNLPLPEFLSQKKALLAEFENTSNPLLASFPKILDARRREGRSEVTLAMVKAAVEYKVHGMAGLQSVTDPAGTGPFGFQRFVFEGVDRGFQLTSVLDAGGFAETLIFVETPGPAFLVGGPHAGQARSR